MAQNSVISKFLTVYSTKPIIESENPKKTWKNGKICKAQSPVISNLYRFI